MQIAGITIDKAAVFAFFQNPQVQTTLRTFIAAPSGWVAVHLAAWLGFDTTQLGMFATYAIYAAPYIVVWGWAMALKTRAAIITQAAQIIAAKDGKAATPAVEKAAGDMVKAVSTMPGVQMAVDTKVASPGVVAAANDPAATNVNPVPAP